MLGMSRHNGCHALLVGHGQHTYLHTSRISHVCCLCTQGCQPTFLPAKADPQSFEPDELHCNERRVLLGGFTHPMQCVPQLVVWVVQQSYMCKAPDEPLMF